MECQIHGVAADPVCDFIVAALLDLNLDAGILFPEGPQQIRKPLHRDAVEGPKLDDSAGGAFELCDSKSDASATRMGGWARYVYLTAFLMCDKFFRFSTVKLRLSLCKAFRDLLCFGCHAPVSNSRIIICLN